MVKKAKAKTTGGKRKSAKADAKAAGEQEKVTPGDVFLMPPEQKLRDLARRCKAWKKQGAEVTGQIGQAIAEASEKIHLDRKAFSMARQLDSMSDKKLAVTLGQLLYMIDVLGIEKRATAQGRLGLDEKEEDEDETDAGMPEGSEGRGGGNVTHIGHAARAVAERAGEA